jgi:hypothetical protein
MENHNEPADSIQRLAVDEITLSRVSARSAVGILCSAAVLPVGTKCFVNLSPKRVDVERLGKEWKFRMIPCWPPGHQNDTDIRSRNKELPRQFDSRHSGEIGFSNKKMDAVLKRARECKGMKSIVGRDDAISLFFKHLLNQVTNGGFLIHEENYNRILR